ncbi:MAG: PH domain-containing protein [Parcubacteria group bacterium]|nr:PH domain-containing protein [Parcubacteria group bacterium]
MAYLGFEIKPQEKIKLVIRSHWFILLSIILKFFFILFIVLSGLYLIARYFNLTLLNNLIPIINSTFLLFWWLGLFHGLTDYYLDVWIVTDHRVLDIRHTGLFNRDISELRLSKIQDITMKTKGIFAIFLDYGDLIIQTAAEEKEFKFESISRPEEIKNLILNAYDDYAREHSNGKENHSI